MNIYELVQRATSQKNGVLRTTIGLSAMIPEFLFPSLDIGR